MTSVVAGVPVSTHLPERPPRSPAKSPAVSPRPAEVAAVSLVLGIRDRCRGNGTTNSHSRNPAASRAWRDVPEEPSMTPSPAGEERGPRPGALPAARTARPRARQGGTAMPAVRLHLYDHRSILLT